MPVTAKLSKRFYDTFGDELANELVDWFNQVDATYRADLREFNELNFQRFDAKLEQRLSEFRAELRDEFRTGLAHVRDELMEALASHRRETDEALGGVRAEIAKVGTSIELLQVQVGTLGTAVGLLQKEAANARAEMERLRTERAKDMAKSLRWMIGFWAGTIIPLAVLMVTLTR